MTDTDLVNDKIRKLIRTTLGWEENAVRPAYQNAPTGTNDEPYATVLLTNFTGGNDANRQKNDTASTNVISDTVGQRQVTAQIQFYRAGAFKNACAIGGLLESQTSIMKMAEIGLGLVRVGQTTNVSKVINTTWEEQASVNVDFNLISLNSESIESFGRFPIEITPANADGELSTTTIEVYEP